MPALMLVSARVSPRLRAEVAAGDRPCPEFLRLESAHGVRLLDWMAVDGSTPTARSVTTSLRHVRAALGPVRQADAVLSDGEHVGIPLALAMQLLGVRVPHATIGHHLTTPMKTACFRFLHAERRIDRTLVHSARQEQLARRRLRLPTDTVQLVPYGVDTDFWKPRDVPEEPLVVAPGREHRDHRTLAEACSGLPARVFVSGTSAHNPRAHHSSTTAWPANVDLGSPDYRALRDLYARAQIVVVPLLRAEFPAGITTVLEAMAMAKPVIVSATAGITGLVRHGETGLLVPPEDAAALRSAITWLLNHPAERRRLSGNARDEAVSRFSLDIYVGRLQRELASLAARSREL